MGGNETDPGIFINWTLRLGTTASRCLTFNKFWPISRDLVFDIRILELWVVNEVVMKRRNTPKRDFYSTVIMWNRIGKHKANYDRSRTDNRNCYHDGLRNLMNDAEIHETDERYFVPSATSLAGTRNVDDELLTAIKNRLHVPPVTGASTLKPKARFLRVNHDSAEVSSRQYYHLDTPNVKTKRVPPHVSAQVDDSMITESKQRSTSTSHVKVASRFTQSGLGLVQMDKIPQIQHSSSGMQQGHPQEQYSQLHRRPSGMVLQPDEQYQQTLQPRQNSFTDYTKQSSLSPALMNPRANYGEPQPVEVSANSIQSDRNSPNLPRVPEYYVPSSQRPSAASRSIRSGTDEVPYSPQIRELSWPGRRDIGAVQPYQQLLQRAQEPDDPYGSHRRASQIGMARESHRLDPPDRSVRSFRSTREAEGSYVPSNNSHRPSLEGSMREVDLNPVPSQQSRQPSPSRSLRTAGSTGENDMYQGPTQRHDRPSVSGSYREVDSSPYEPPQRQGSERDLGEQRSTSPPPPQTVLAVTTIDSVQLCKCGSKELNLLCSCKKSTLEGLEVVTKSDPTHFRECFCPRSYDNEKTRKKKKEKKSCAEKEAKADEKRRKKEEKERLKREKKEQKAREKESKKGKREKKSKNKNKKGCKMCSCCKCCGGDDVETTVCPSETSQPSCPSNKKSKKQKKPKEKKQKEKKEKKPKEKKNKKSRGYKDCLRSCECPQSFKLEDSTQDIGQSCPLEMVQQKEPSVLGYCNHPDSPCPALGNSRVQFNKLVTLQANSERYCRDPACTNAKRFPRESGEGNSNVSAYAVMVDQHPSMFFQASRNINRNSPTTLIKTNKNTPQAINRNLEATRHRDIIAAPGLMHPNEIGHGDTPHFGRRTTGSGPSTSPHGFSTNENLLIDLSKRGNTNNANKHYVPPCVLYLDCTKVKDLCVIIKDKYEEGPS